MKRLNNGGWGEKDMMISCGIIALVLLVIYIMLNQFQSMMSNVQESDSSKKEVKEEINRDTTSGVITETEEKEDQDTIVVDDNYYISLEESMKVAAKAYIQNEYETLNDDTIMHITLEQLESKNFLDKVQDQNGNICSGYVTYTSANDSYEAYLNCNTYVTDGYETQYE